MIARADTLTAGLAMLAEAGRDLASCTTPDDLGPTLAGALGRLLHTEAHWLTDGDALPPGAPSGLRGDDSIHEDGWHAWPLFGPDGTQVHVVFARASLDDDQIGVVQALVDQTTVVWGSIGNFQMLEALVADEMASAVQREEKIQLILDSMHDALVVCDRDGQLTEICSATATRWFGSPPDGTTIWDYLFPDDAGPANMFAAGWMQLVEAWLPFEVAVDQLPSRFSRDGRTFEIELAPVHEGGAEELTGIVVTASDITALVAAEEAERIGRELVAVVQHIARDAVAFRSALSDLRQLVDDLPGSSLTLTKRILHTLKGNCATLGLGRMVSVCHHQEDRLAEDSSALPLVVAPVAKAWADAEDMIEPLLPRSGAVNVSAEALDEVIDLLATERWTKVVDVVGTWRFPSLSSVFTQLTEGLDARAAAYGKGVDVQLDVGNLHVPYAEAESFFRSLAHVVRNAVAHGIEPGVERLAAGKPERGLLTVRAHTKDNQLVLDITDDGAGIDWSVIERKAAERGMPCDTPEERIAVLLAPGFSTKEVADDLAGRGVGLDAVKGEMDALGIQLDIYTQRGEGTGWRFQVPLTR